MKKFMIILCLSLSLIGSSAYAYEENVVKTDGLTQSEKAKIEFDIAKINEERANAKPTQNTVETVSEYVKIGKDLGSGLAATAKEMGVAVNDFATTPVGKFAMVALAWKFFGMEVARLIVSAIFMLVALPFWAYAFNRVCIIKNKTINYYDIKDPKFAGGPKKVITKEFHTNKQGEIFEMLIALLILIGIACMIGL